MATNIQIGLAYAIGAIGNQEHKMVHLEEVLKNDIYKPYVITMHSGLNGNKSYVLYKNLSATDGKSLVKIDTEFSLTQVIHIIEEVIAYDLKR